MSRLLTFAVASLSFASGLRAVADGPAPNSTRQGVGVVVESVDEASPPARAGIRAGDVLIGWERAANPPANPTPEHGSFGSPMEVDEVRIEESERGRLTFFGLRDGAKRSFEISPDWEDLYQAGRNDLKLALRPPLERSALDGYLVGLDLIHKKRIDDGVSAWRSLAVAWSKDGPSLTAIWLWFRIGAVFVDAERFDEALTALEAALAGANTLRADSVIKPILCIRGFVLHNQRNHAGQIATLDEIISLAAGERRPSLWAAKALDSKGIVRSRAGHPDEGERCFRQAVEICEKAAPGGFTHQEVLANLGSSEIELGDLVAAEGHQRASLAITEKLNREDLAWHSLLNLGTILLYRGDLAGADAAYRAALAVTLRMSPGKSREAYTRGNLGEVALNRGDLVEAERYLRQSLAIDEKNNFGKRDHADALTAVAEVVAARSDFPEAEALYRQALAIHEKLYPDSLVVTSDLDGLGRLALAGGDQIAARSDFARALAIREKVAPGGIDVATTLNGLGDASVAAGELESARGYYERSLTLLEGLSPGSLSHAKTLHDIGQLYRKERRLKEAARFLQRAVDALESQKRKLGGTEEVRGLFAASHADFYRDYIEVLIDLGKKDDAFRILERSRAQALLEMLAERDVVFAADVPADLERERKLTDAAYDRAQGDLRESGSKDAEEQRETVTRLHELRQKQEHIADRLKQASPKYAALQYPQPLDLRGTRAALDPGTLLLSYSIGKERSFLFAVSADSKEGPSLSVYTLPVGEKALRESVKAFRRLIEWGEPSPELSSRARSLYDTLLKPADTVVERSERLLILPDGPLHTLPWAALVRGVESGKPQFLIEWKSLSTAISATVYAELRKDRRSPATRTIEVAAFGDPKYLELSQKKIVVRRGETRETSESETAQEEAAVDDVQVRSVLRGGFRFEPLPASRQEVEQIASLYAPKAVAYLGPDATEEKAKSIGKDVPMIHFATHALINERFPLDSALVFTIPEHPKEGQDNGLLQAWEIFERVRIDADLVTLSACDSGLGKEMGGEGLIGLTRAFQYAGARSVLASLWKVEDKATGELMKRFYTYLKAGKTKDEALRSAQIDLIHSADYSHPRDWAAFQLNGDWK